MLTHLFQQRTKVQASTTVSLSLPTHKCRGFSQRFGEDALSMTLAMHIYDCLLGLEPIDWRERLESVTDEAKAMVKEAREKSAEKRHANTHPSHDLEAYIGTYENAAYSVLNITLVDGELQAHYNSRDYQLKHFHYDQFQAEHTLGDDVPPFPASFQIGQDGEIASFSLQLEGGVKPISFERKPIETE